jgi:hypothetical protein
MAAASESVEGDVKEAPCQNSNPEPCSASCACSAGSCSCSRGLRARAASDGSAATSVAGEATTITERIVHSGDVGDSFPPTDHPLGGHPEYVALLTELHDLHKLKSGGYGTDEDAFANFTAVASRRNQPRFLYALDRLVEKVTRCDSLIAQGRYDELGVEFSDIASLALCCEAMRREDSY